MEMIRTFISFILVLNTILAIVTVFKEKRDIAATWAWLIVLIMMPIFGFVIYIFIGRKISKDKLFDIQTQENIGLSRLIKAQKKLLKEHELFQNYYQSENEISEMVNMFLKSSDAVLTQGNEVDLIVDGKDKFEKLIEDISKAKHHIHVTYYIYRNDEIGRKLLAALEERAKNGVEVLVIYDPLGSHQLRKSFFEQLRAYGGKAEPFFDSTYKIINIRINYRNHRKMVIIDGKTGYTGGFNVGDDYLGKYPKMGYWRDTHLRIRGNGVMPLQTRFLMDWNASVKEYSLQYSPHYFPIMRNKGNVALQVVSSGPDSEIYGIKKGFLKMIMMARKSILIQTPYFVPDESVIEALQIALLSGIKVKLMIPNKPDHFFIYRATLYYASELVDYGAEVYIYDAGFLHAKTIVVDSEVSSVGTANFDIRSFKLNFEVNVFMYDKTIAHSLSEQFDEDTKVSYLLTPEIINNFSEWEKFKQKFSRLFSPML